MDASKLSEPEKLAARMFFDVSVQAAFAMEDPNKRFATVFKHKGAEGPDVVTIADIANRSYDTEVDGVYVAFEAKPKNSIALSRVLIQGGARPPLMKFVHESLGNIGYFSRIDLGNMTVPDDVAKIPPGAGSRMYTLVIEPSLRTEHDVAVMFAWGLTSDKGTMMEFSAWPIDKVVKAKA